MEVDAEYGDMVARAKIVLQLAPLAVDPFICVHVLNLSSILNFRWCCEAGVHPMRLTVSEPCCEKVCCRQLCQSRYKSILILSFFQPSSFHAIHGHCFNCVQRVHAWYGMPEWRWCKQICAIPRRRFAKVLRVTSNTSPSSTAQTEFLIMW